MGIATNRRARRIHAAAIDRIITQEISVRSPGLAIAVIRDGETVHSAGYGLSNLTTRARITPKTQFHLASCGKQLTGLGIMILKEDGKLRFDDPIGRHIPELSGFPKAITIRRLLHHLSGVLDIYSDEESERRLLAMSPRPTNEDLIRFYSELDCPICKSYGIYRYNNAGYDLLGCVIERVSGQFFHEFFRTRVLDPLGMNDTFSISAETSSARRRLATGYEYDDRKKRFIAESGSPLDGIAGSGSFYSTVSDLCRYEAALANNRLVSKATMRTALRSAVDRNGRSVAYGFGWRLAPQFAEHSGNWAGFSSLQRRYSDQPLSMYILSNNTKIQLEKIMRAVAEIYRS